MTPATPPPAATTETGPASGDSGSASQTAPQFATRDREILYRLRECIAIRERWDEREAECSQQADLAKRELELARAYRLLAEDRLKLADERLALEREKTEAGLRRIADLEAIVKGITAKDRKWWCFWLCKR